MSDPRSSPQTAPIALELFAGAGGLALGTHCAGFRHIALAEWDPCAVLTLRANSRRLLGLDPNSVLMCDAGGIDSGLYAGNMDLLTGGPPCQPFSSGGLKNGHSDPRDMFPTFLNAVALLMPRAILIENVRGLLRPSFSDYFSYIMGRLRYPLHSPKRDELWRDHLARMSSVKESFFSDEQQYVVNHQVVDTADYGIPQRRHRVFITAFRRDLDIDTFQLPATHSKEALLWEQCVTRQYWARHGMTPIPVHDQSDLAIIERLRSSLIPPQGRLPWRTVRDALIDLPAPTARGDKETLPNHVQHPGARSYAGHTGSSYDYPAKALKAGTHGTPGGENTLRVPPGDGVRYLTTREAARLHTFPDEWYFHGSWGACIKQLGNAVPVEMARLFAAQIHSRLISHHVMPAIEPGLGA